MASSSHIAFSLTIVIALTFTIPPGHAAALMAAGAQGFSIELIHRDSPKSPLYNPLTTHLDRVRAAARRSAFRISGLDAASSDGSIQSRMVSDVGEYLMEFEVGTPPFKLVAIADTGSDLIWTNCEPCRRCYKQVPPRFDPGDSSTYRHVSCEAQACNALPYQSCGNDSTCSYHYAYGDRSNVDGVLATDTFTFSTSGGSGKVSIPKIAFGCNQQSSGTFSNRTAGLVGLGGGQVSLVSQLLSSIDRKYFSYCMVPMFDTKSSSHLSFGSAAVFSGSDVVTTPMTIVDTFYYLSLEEISVGGKTIAVPGSGNGNGGNDNIIIDSGTTLTFLNPSTFQGLEQVLTDIIKLPLVSDEGLPLCFDISGSSDYKFPDITFKFDRAPLKLSPSNTFIEWDTGVVCLAMAASSDIQIFGNIAQQNFHVGYDVGAQQISFAPTDCTKL